MAKQHQTTFEGSTASVLVVIPCLNEEEHLAGVIGQLLADADRINLAIIVADGGSTDGSRAIARDYMARDRRVVLMENPKRIQSAGVNSAVARYGSDFDFLIRVDAHARYPNRFCERLLNVQARTRADSIVVSMHTVGNSCFQRAAAAAQNSILGNGGALHRNVAREGWVDHGHHALMTIRAFKAVGGYDDSFSHVEDVELDIRLRTSGFAIFLTGEVEVTYYPRRTMISKRWLRSSAQFSQASKEREDPTSDSCWNCSCPEFAPAGAVLVHLCPPSAELGTVVSWLWPSARRSPTRSLRRRGRRRCDRDAGWLVSRIL